MRKSNKWVLLLIKFHVYVTDEVSHEMKIQGNAIKKDDGNKYFEISSVKIHIKPKKIIFRFDKLFKDNKELGEILFLLYYPFQKLLLCYVDIFNFKLMILDIYIGLII